jgi:K+-transporting ATPase ATPase A chain
MLYVVMLTLFVGGFAAVWGAEHAGNPIVHHLGVAGPNLEGKETRFGDTASALSVTVATDTSSGASNVAYDSLMPMSALVALINMQIGEVVFGGVGSGLYGIILLTILAVFIAGFGRAASARFSTPSPRFPQTTAARWPASAFRRTSTMRRRRS